MEKKSAGSRYAWLDVIRAVAVLLVLWDHFVGMTAKRLGVAFYPDQFVESKILRPLAITQSGGFLGVTLFFLISGYIITGVGKKESMRTFAIRRTLRIFPPLIVAVLVSLVVRQFVNHDPFNVTLGDIVRNFFLVNWVRQPQVIIVGVAWSLVIEVTFYLVVLFMLPLLHRPRLTWVLPFSLVALSVLFVQFNNAFGPSFQAIAVSFLYIPILSIGCTFALLERGTLSARAFTLHALLAGTTFMFATWKIYPQFLRPEDSYPVSALLAIGIFAIAWAQRAVIPDIRILTLIALTSYSIYLFHEAVGMNVLLTSFHADPSHNFPRALLLAVVATTVTTVVVYNAVERPSKWLATRLTSAPRRASGVSAPQAASEPAAEMTVGERLTPPSEATRAHQ